GDGEGSLDTQTEILRCAQDDGWSPLHPSDRTLQRGCRGGYSSMYKARFLVPIAVLALLSAGCGSGGLGGSVSLDQEWQLGQQMAAQVNQQIRLVQDPQALAYVRMVGERLHAATPLADRPFEFEIGDDPNVNAFAVPGGHIYINRGTITTADKVD